MKSTSLRGGQLAPFRWSKVRHYTNFESETILAFKDIERHLENLKRYTRTLFIFAQNKRFQDAQNRKHKLVEEYLSDNTVIVPSLIKDVISRTKKNPYTRVEKPIVFPFDELKPFFNNIDKSFLHLVKVIRPVHDRIIKNRLDLYYKEIDNLNSQLSTIKSICKDKEKIRPFYDIMFHHSQIEDAITSFTDLLFPNIDHDIEEIDDLPKTDVFKFHLFKELGLFDFLESEYGFKNKDTIKIRRLVENMISVSPYYQKELINKPHKIGKETRRKVELLIETLNS